MNDKNLNNGGDVDFSDKAKLILINGDNIEFNSGLTQKADELLNNNDIFDKEISNVFYNRFKIVQRKRKLYIKRFVLISACIMIFATGFGAYANSKGLFSRFFKSNDIHFNAPGEIKEIENTFERFPDLETAAQEYKLKLPILSVFPEELKITNVTSEVLEGLIRINAIYTNNDFMEKIKIRYEYIDMKKNKGSISINETYDNLGYVEVLAGTAHIYSDMERKIAIIDNDNYIISIETTYSQEQLEEILKNMKMR